MGRGVRVATALVAIVVWQLVSAIVRRGPRVDEFDASALVGSTELGWRWIVVGDSTTTGPGVAGPHEIWIRQLAERFADRRSIDIVSLAIGGSRARDVVLHQLDAATAVRADIAFVSVGANDVLKGVSLDDYTTNLDKIVERLTAVHGLVVVSGVGDLSSIPRLNWPLTFLVGRRGRRFDEVAEQIAGRYGALKVDQWSLSAPRFRSTPGVYSADLLHPTPLGHGIWADAVEATITPHLQRLP